MKISAQKREREITKFKYPKINAKIDINRNLKCI